MQELELLDFQNTYNKNYLTTFEDNRRKRIFEENVKLTDANNERYDKGEVPFKMSIDGYADRAKDEFLRLRTGLSIPLRFE